MLIFPFFPPRVRGVGALETVAPRSKLAAVQHTVGFTDCQYDHEVHGIEPPRRSGIVADPQCAAGVNFLVLCPCDSIVLPHGVLRHHDARPWLIMISAHPCPTRLSVARRLGMNGSILDRCVLIFLHERIMISFVTYLDYRFWLRQSKRVFIFPWEDSWTLLIKF